MIAAILTGEAARRDPRVELNDFRRQWRAIEGDAVAAMRDVGASGWYVLGEAVRAFEAALAATCGVADTVGVASGLDAIEIALRCRGIRPGDRVLTTPLSAFATTLAVVRVGAVPVFVDVDERGLLDLELARRALADDPAIRALLVVHLYGQPHDLGALEALGVDFDLRLVEDCAQAIGAKWRDRPVGTVAEVSALSFYPTKNLGALGDGGAVLFRDAGEASDTGPAELARALRHYGQTALYRHDHVGWNSRLDELQAAILHRALLPRLDTFTARRRRIAARYLAGITCPDLRLPEVAPGADPVWHLFAVRVPPGAGRRDDFRAHLERAGIASGVHYPTLVPDQRALDGVAHEVVGDLRRARDFADNEVSLPIHPFLEDEEVARVIDAANAWGGTA